MARWRKKFHQALVAGEKRLDRWKYHRLGGIDRDEPIQILPFRGFGNARRVFVKGRVLENEYAPASPDDGRLRHLYRMFRRFETDEVPGARVRVRAGELQTEIEADDEGYFEAELETSDGLERRSDPFWYGVDLELIEEGLDGSVTATAEVMVPPSEAEFVVVSDVDDTIVHTGATRFLRMVRIVLFNSGFSRLPMPGVAKLYEGLQNGSGDSARNPIFYVSSSPWNIYDLFVNFVEHRGIPSGPFLLKEFGIDEDKLIKSGHSGHKSGWIRRLMEFFPDLPFLLIGDSGQEDPEIYRDVALEAPERVLGIYIREVTGERRKREVREMARSLEARGVTMKSARSSLAAAEHARSQGWITAAAVDAVRGAGGEATPSGPSGSLFHGQPEMDN